MDLSRTNVDESIHHCERHLIQRIDIRLFALEKNDLLDLLRFCGRRRERNHERNEEISKNYDEGEFLRFRTRKETV